MISSLFGFLLAVGEVLLAESWLFISLLTFVVHKILEVLFDSCSLCVP